MTKSKWSSHSEDFGLNLTQNIAEEAELNLVTCPSSKILQKLGDLDTIFGAIFGIRALLFRYRSSKQSNEDQNDEENSEGKNDHDVQSPFKEEDYREESSEMSGDGI